MRRLAAVLAVVGGMVSCSVPAHAGMLDWINAERAERDRPPLSSAPAIADGARDHSREMYKRGTLFHDEAALAATLDAHASGWDLGGETIASGPADQPMRDVFKAWMRSDTHRQVMLLERFTHVAFGIIQREGIRIVTAYYYDD